MRRKCTTVILVILIFSFFIYPATASFHYGYSTGEEFRYRTLSRISSSMETNNLVVDNTVELVAEFTQMIVEKGKDNFSFNIVFDSFEAREHNQEMKSQREDRISSTVDHRDDFQKNLNDLKGLPLIQFNIDTRGNLLEKEVAEKVKEVTQVNLSSIVQQILMSFPEDKKAEKEVEWSAYREFALPQGGHGTSLVTKVDYKVLEEVEIDDVSCLMIEAQLDFEDSVPLREEGEKQGEIQIKHRGLGFIYYSPEEGRLIRTIFSQNMEVKVFLEEDRPQKNVDSILNIKMDHIITSID